MGRRHRRQLLRRLRSSERPEETLAALSPEQASAEWGGNSVAAHAHHILFSLSASAAWISGDHSSRDWNESWKISAVDAKQWAVLQTDLGKGFDDLRGAIDAHANDPESVASALGAVAHVAYHLGAIRQKVAAGR